MFGLFRKRKKAQPGAVTNSLAKTIVRAQIACTTRMNKLSARWSNRAKILFLAVFTGVMVLMTILQVRIALHTSPSRGNAPSTLVKPPARSNDLRRLIKKQDSLLYAAFLQRLQQLQATPEGRDSLQRFEQSRPGFIDSVMQWGSRFQDK